MNALEWGCIWVVAATLVAFLPLRFQYLPGIVLLLGAPYLIWRIGAEHGWLPLLLAAAAVVSMFRRPLRYLALRVAGRTRDEAMGRASGGRAP